MFSTMAASAVTAKECLQSAEVCLALAHKTKELDTRAALLEIAYEFRTVACVWSVLALLWQIYSCCFSLQIHFLQRGHRCGGGRAISSKICWRPAGQIAR